MLILEWKCDQCGELIEREPLAEVSDSYDIYHPDSVFWHGDGEGHSWELCRKCHKKWKDKIRKENPNAVWMA